MEGGWQVDDEFLEMSCGRMAIGVTEAESGSWGKLAYIPLADGAEFVLAQLYKKKKMMMAMMLFFLFYKDKRLHQARAPSNGFYHSR